MVIMNNTRWSRKLVTPWDVAYVIDTVVDTRGIASICGIYNINNNDNYNISNNITITTLPVPEVSQNVVINKH